MSETRSCTTCSTSASPTSTMPDVSERAWGRARRIRRRRTTAAVAGARGRRGGHRGRRRRPRCWPATAPSGPLPAPPRPGRAGTDAPDRGPDPPARPGRASTRARRALPRRGGSTGARRRARRRRCRAPPRRSRTPSTCPRPRPTWRTGRSARPWPPTRWRRRRRHPAAAARPADGTLRSVDTSRVAPLDDGAGADVYGRPASTRALARPGSTSRSRRRAACWCSTLATGRWRDDRHRGPGHDRPCTWTDDTELWLPRTSQGGWGPAVLRARRDAGPAAAPAWPVPTPGFAAGRRAVRAVAQLGPGGLAQAWARVPGLPGADAARPRPRRCVAGRGDDGGARRAAGARLPLDAAGAAAPTSAAASRSGWTAADVVAYGRTGAPRAAASRGGSAPTSVRQVTTIDGTTTADRAVRGRQLRDRPWR